MAEILVWTNSNPLCVHELDPEGSHDGTNTGRSRAQRDLAPDILPKADRLVCTSLPECRKLGEPEFLPVDRVGNVTERGAVVAGAADGRVTEDDITHVLSYRRRGAGNRHCIGSIRSGQACLANPMRRQKH